MKSSKLSFFLAVSWFLLTTLLLIIPGSKFPTENWFDKIWLDKWVHVSLFAMMVWLWCRATFQSNKNGGQLTQSFYLIALIWIIYGIGMEFVQRYLVANRSFDTGDIIADAVGCAAGLIFSIRKYVKK